MRLRLRAAVAAVLVLVSGCATPMVEVSVSSNTRSLRVLEGDRVLGAGAPPVRVTLPANLDHDLTLVADGYEAQPLRVSSVTNGAWIARFVCVSIVCPIALFMLPVALSRGAHRTLNPTEVEVALAPGGSRSPHPFTSRPAAPVAPRPTPQPAPRPSPQPAPRPTTSTPPPARAAFCGHCGARAAGGAAFCGGCGRRR